MPDVHSRHCCIHHGCKYGDPLCTVTNEKEMQEYLCEDCYYVIENINTNMIEVYQYYDMRHRRGQLKQYEKEFYACLLKVMLIK